MTLIKISNTIDRIKVLRKTLHKLEYKKKNTKVQEQQLISVFQKRKIQIDYIN